MKTRTALTPCQAYRGRSCWLSFLVSAVTVFGAEAAQTEAPKKSGAARGDEPVVMSPFEVKTDGDVGYIATNSLAGSRLNTALKDTPAIIDVFTKEFLLDLGATDLQQAMVYSNNSQQDDGDAERSATGGAQTNAGNAFNFRSRGIRGNSTRNYFETRLGTDLYNVERLDDSRGPNSVLFGIGSAGGLINNSTKRAQMGQRLAETQFMAGSQERFRGTVDFNQPLLAQRLALRVNALYDDKGSWREYLHTRKKAASAALTFRPFAQTEVRVDAETGRLRGTIARNYPAVDGITKWWNNGSASVATISTTALTAAETTLGFTRPLTASRLVYVENQAYVMDVRNAWATAQDTPYASNIVNDPARVPYKANPVGPGGRTFHDFENITAVIEHRFTRNLSGEIGFYHEAGDWTNYDVGGTSDNVTIQGDPNGLLRNPTTVQGLAGFKPATDATGNLINPYAGRTYLETRWGRGIARTDSNNLRATLAYEKDAGRWGLHRLAGLAQHQVENSKNYSESEIWLGAPFATGPIADNNAVWRRAYVTLGEAASQRVPDPLNPAVLTVNYPGRAAPLTSGWVLGGNGGAYSRRTIDSQMLAAQSSWWGRRIVTTLGYRRDQLEQTRTNPSRDTSGIWAGSNGNLVFDANSPTTSFEFSGHTTTAGIVVHPLKWLSVFANGSRNLGLPDFTLKIGPDAGVPPAPVGKGIDAGVLFHLRDERIVARISYFSTVATDQASFMGVASAFIPRYDNVFKILEDPNGDRSTADQLYTAAQLAKYAELRPRALMNADTFDNDNHGYEARLTANVGESLRLIVNYSYSQQERTNVYKRTRPMFEQLDQFIAELQKANPGVDVLNARGPVGQSIRDIVAANWADLDGRTLDFAGAYGNRNHKANFFANYTFKDGQFKGWSAGLGGRYLSPIVAGRVVTGPGTPPANSAGANGVGVNGPVVYGSDNLRFDAMLRYQTRLTLFGRNTRLSLQLNVRNLLDDHDIEIRRYKTDGVTLQSFVLTDPREFTVATTLRF
jgi:outer membrane receptor protein involved in Fe transport